MTSDSTIALQVEELVREALPEDVRLTTAEADLPLDSLGLDSLAATELILNLEDRLGFLFPEESLSRELFSSLNRLTAVVVDLLHAGNGVDVEPAG